MEKIILELQKLSHAAKKGSRSDVEKALREIKNLIGDKPTDTIYQQLKTEVLAWESKLTVILNEPAAKNGMARHAEYWIEKIG